MSPESEPQSDNPSPNNSGAAAPASEVNSSDAGLPSSESTGFSRIEAAMNRAEKTIRDEPPSSTKTDNPTTTDGQAAASESSDSPRHGAEGSQAEQGEASGSDSLKIKNDSPSEQPLTAPESWPADRKTVFSELDPKGQETLLAIHGDMVKGLHKSQEKLASEREALKSNFGAEPEALKELVEMATTFQDDPVSVFTKLAEQSGVEIFFKPQGEQQIPDFESAEDQTRWLLQQQQQQSRQAAADKATEDARERAQEEQRQQVTEQFAQAHQAHPDLADHRDQVVTHMVNHQIPVEEAYRLATYDGMQQLAQQASGYKADLEKAQSEIESLKKSSTVPPQGHGGSHHTAPAAQQAGGLTGKIGSAFERAERKRAKG